MIRTLILPGIACAAFSFMTWHLVKTHRELPDLPPPVEPSRSPYQRTIAGAGLVEPRSENIKVAAVVAGVVETVYVKVGQQVDKGDVLFELDDRNRRADLAVQQALHAEAEAAYRRLSHAPRKEDVPPSEARVQRALAEMRAQKDLLDRAEKLFAKKAVSEEDLIQRRQAYGAAKAALEEAETQDARLKAGSWEEDLAVARSQVECAVQRVRQAQVELDRLKVRAPIQGTVLKVDVRPGEYVGTPPGQTLLILGDLSELHVRVDIDEQDLPRFRPGLPGTGYVRGDAATAIPLRFVRVEPYAEPKKSLTNAGNERVDTRVLQVIYALEDSFKPVYVGQQLDVFLNAEP